MILGMSSRVGEHKCDNPDIFCNSRKLRGNWLGRTTSEILTLVNLHNCL